MDSKIQLMVVGLICSIGMGCSNSSDQLTGNVFTVTNDCNNAQVQETSITAFNGSINTGGLGFPQLPVQIGQDSTGTVGGGGGALRTCTATYGKDIADPDEAIYSCFDNGAYACSIIIREN